MAEVEEQIVETTEEVVEAPIEEVIEETPVKEKSPDANLIKLREAKEKAEHERDKLLEHYRNEEKKKQVVPEKEERFFDLAPDDLAEVKHLETMAKRIKDLENMVKNNQNQSNTINIETKLRNKFPDFESVVNSGNLASLKKDYPEIASSLVPGDVNDSKEMYNKAVSAYTLLKKFGIYVEDTHQAEKDVVKNNAAKPKPLASISPQQGDSPLSKANAFANGLTPELKAQLYQEVLDAKNR